MCQTSKFLALGLLLLASCSERPSGTKAKTGPPVDKKAPVTVGAATYKLNTGQMNWTASKPTGKHLGTVDIAEGQLSIDGEDVVAGTFKIEMTSLVSIDLEGEKKSKLESHLKSQDFFAVDQYPASNFNITGADLVKDQPSCTHNISGDLTIKETTKNITIPINISFVGDKILAASPAFTINRTEWGINYNSGILGTAADKLIHDEVSLVITFEADKQ